MRARFATAIGFLLVGLAQPLSAQELIGFDLRDKGKVVLSHRQSGVELELAIGNYNNESIRNYSTGSIFSRLGRSVGRLDIYTDVQIFPCTAFIVSEKYVLTNYHCVPGVIEDARTGATRIDGVRFLAGYTQQGIEENANLFEVNPVPVEAHEDLDYAVLEVLGNPSETFGKLALAAATPNDADPYWIIGHPMGEAQRISREQCRANVPALSGGRLLHTCDTLPGNSGSPVIDAGLQTVIGLHHAGSSRDSVNFAIPMQLILQRSKVLAAAVPPGQASSAPVVVANPANLVCDALYVEARESKDCLAYEIYGETCSEHPLNAIATRFRERNCAPVQTAAAAPAKPAPVPVQKPEASTAAQPSDLEQELAKVIADLDAENERSVELDLKLTKALQELNVAKIVGQASKIVDAQNKVASLSRSLDATVSRATKLRLRRSELLNRMPLRPAALRGPDWEGGSVTFTELAYRMPNDTFDDSSRAVNPTWDKVAIGGDLGEIWVWDTRQGRVILETDNGSPDTEVIAYDPSGSFIAGGHQDGSVVLIDADSGALRYDIQAHDRRVKSVAFSPDSLFILTTSADAKARVFKASNGRLVTDFTGHDRSGTAGVFSPDGRRAVTGSTDNSVISWDAMTGRIEQRFTGHTHWVNAVAVSADGTRVVSGGADKTARVWDMATGKEMAVFEHPDWVISVDFSPDGNLIATTARDGAGRIIDLATGRTLRRLNDRAGEVRFGSDGHSLVAWDQYGIGVYRLR